jgi:hypothetical protein
MASMLADALSVHLGLMLMDEVLGCMCPVHIMYIRDFRNQAFPMFTDNRIRQDQQEMRSSNPPFQAFVFPHPITITIAVTAAATHARTWRGFAYMRKGLYDV